MPFCPECRYEYVPGHKECPDCHVKLVEELPERASGDPSEKEYVELHPLPGHIYAEMVKEVFDKEGIECILIPDVISTGLLVKGTDVAGNEVRIRVFKEDQEQAQEILHSMMDHI
ncbi:hypothetical protein EH223_01860 [candidate division KSB1 bacterium]|nr:DUF2007 domain-containing protein [candidate division KSB1 bacterium]RQW06731.1 MAG: hypothetical protein EH223_01860 [candidate division KSB1 bacterium]